MSQCNSRVTVILLTCSVLPCHHQQIEPFSHCCSVLREKLDEEMKTIQLHLHFLSLALLAGSPDEDGCDTTRTVG